MSIEKKRFECSALPKGWQREEVIRKSGLSAGKVDVCYYSPDGQKFDSKPQLVRAISESVDLTAFDFSTVEEMPSHCCVPMCSTNYRSSDVNCSVFTFPKNPMLRREWLKAIGRPSYKVGKASVVCIRHFEDRSIIKEDRATRPDGSVFTLPRSRLKLAANAVPSLLLDNKKFLNWQEVNQYEGGLVAPEVSSQKLHQPDKSHHPSPKEIYRGVRNDASLVPPIRQTASIFKQPVTVFRSQEGKSKSDFKHGPQEKPKQLFWEKRLEGIRASDAEGNPLEPMELPRSLRPAGPGVSDETLLQSVATSLHVLGQPITGQANLKPGTDKNPAVFINPDQPLMQAVSITDEDIKRQEERVNIARRKLQEVMKDYDP